VTEKFHALQNNFLTMKTLGDGTAALSGQ